MGDFLDMLELSERLKCLESDSYQHEAKTTTKRRHRPKRLATDTVFVRDCNDEILPSKGVVMPVASEVKAKKMKLRLLRKWEKQIAEEEQEKRSDKEDSDVSSLLSDENLPEPETLKQIKSAVQLSTSDRPGNVRCLVVPRHQV
ncbi:hypothetical protein PC129_g20808 [Phytophthora cactorum]|nr:hypothetical protein Pcac1_g6897 [Phytophthora cactorum]KAG2804973.1 hypothetical protein PC112_g18484 [Phytophthora cactorum]KAG2806389.1 hypothetical protein PC111_g17386 [Phytophthora cactorum]KAG2844316.1 hypothetical protein PC113_g18417 [Phytophthora cactorum]KAG2884569.1 hypothetical protein PC114_g20032 [Phytophthora cactorum]